MSARRQPLQIRLGPGLGVVLALLVAPACTRQSTEGSVAPLDTGHMPREDDPKGRAVGESRDELELQLEDLVQQQQGAAAASGSDPALCEDSCSLAAGICEVSVKLCEIADRHLSEESYAQLCRRSKRQCKDAQDDCVDCVEIHESGSAEAAPVPARTP